MRVSLYPWKSSIGVPKSRVHASWKLEADGRADWRSRKFCVHVGKGPSVIGVVTYRTYIDDSSGFALGNSVWL